MIKIKVKNESYDVVKKEVQVVLDVSVDIKKMLEADYSRDREDIFRGIKNIIVEKVTTDYYDKFADEIIKRVDLEAIIKRVQLNIVGKL